MYIEATGVARISHAETGEVFEIDSDDIEWEPIATSERQMGEETIYGFEINHERLGTLRWELSEYPIGVTNHITHQIGEHELVDDFEFVAVPEASDYDEPFELRVEEEPAPRPAGPIRYQAAEDDVGVTADELSRLPEDEQVPYLTYWFFTYYEDPSEETPHNSREGGFQYIWGGPYDANDALFQEFSGTVSEEALQSAVDEVQSGGIYDWAPTSAHPDRTEDGPEKHERNPLNDLEREVQSARAAFRSGAKPKFGTDEEVASRERVLAAFDHLAMALPPDPKDRVRGGIGDNNPPADERFTEEELAEVRLATDEIRGQLKADEPNVEQVAKSTVVLTRVARAIARRCGILAGEMASAFVKAFGTTLGKGAAATAVLQGTGLWDPLISALATVGPWLAALF